MKFLSRLAAAASSLACLAGTALAQAPIPAADMAKLLASDRNAYFDRYADKPIVITGNIGDVDQGGGGVPGRLTLDGMTTDHGGLDVRTRDGVSLKDVKPGQKIAVLCTLKAPVPYPQDCTIVAVTAGRLPWPDFADGAAAIAARDLARAFKADKEAALSRYGGKAAVIVGKIGEVNRGGLGRPSLLLDGSGPLSPDAFLLELAADTPLAGLKVDTEVTMICVISVDSDKAKACRPFQPGR